MNQNLKNACFLLTCLNDWTYKEFLKFLVDQGKTTLFFLFQKQEVCSEFQDDFLPAFRDFISGKDEEEEEEDSFKLNLLYQQHCQVLAQEFSKSNEDEFLSLFTSSFGKNAARIAYAKHIIEKNKEAFIKTLKVFGAHLFFGLFILYLYFMYAR